MTGDDFPVGGSPETVAKWFGFASVAELDASHARYAEEMTADAIAEELAEAVADAAGAVWPSADELAEMSMYDQEMWERRCADAEAADAEAEPEAEL